MISIVIPVYNEETILSGQREYFTALSKETELIFVDGGSDDDTVRRALDFGEVISTKKNRSFQMNAGARLAKNDILLFLHADTCIPKQALRRVKTAVTEDGFIGGCFCQVIDNPRLIFKWIAWTGNLRAKMFKVFYGDQGIFVRRDIFEKLGGFPDTALAEDVFFTRKLRQEGKVGVLDDPIYCSARRWVDQGIGKTFLLNMKITAGLLKDKNIDLLSKEYKDIREKLK